MILRGSNAGGNYDVDSISSLAENLRNKKLPFRVMVDCSHGNSDKDHRRQPAVARDIAAQIADGSEDVFGVMLESHLVAGSQRLGVSELVYGQSITDACMGWDETAAVLEELAAAVAKRRAAA